MSHETEGRIKGISIGAAILVALGFVAFMAAFVGPKVGDHYAAQKLEGWQQRSAKAVAVEPVFGVTEGGGFLSGPTLEARRPATYIVPGVGRERVIADAAVVKGDTSTAWYKPSTGEVKLTADQRLYSCDFPDNTGGCGSFGDLMEILVMAVVPGLGVIPVGFLAYFIISQILFAGARVGHRRVMSNG